MVNQNKTIQPDGNNEELDDYATAADQCNEISKVAEDYKEQGDLEEAFQRLLQLLLFNKLFYFLLFNLIIQFRQGHRPYQGGPSHIGDKH